MFLKRRTALCASLVLVLITSLSGLSFAGQQNSPASSEVSGNPAGATPAAAVGGSTAEAEQSSKMICRQTSPIGTRIPKKTCKTAAQWEELRRMGSEAARKGEEQGRLCGENCSAPGG